METLNVAKIIPMNFKKFIKLSHLELIFDNKKYASIIEENFYDNSLYYNNSCYPSLNSLWILYSQCISCGIRFSSPC